MYELIHSEHTGVVAAIKKLSDGTQIPITTTNRGYVEFLEWNAAQPKSKRLDVTDRIEPVHPPDNLVEVLAQQDRIEAREQQIAEEKIAADARRKERFDAAVAAGRYHPDGTPTEAEEKRIGARHEANRLERERLLIEREAQGGLGPEYG